MKAEGLGFQTCDSKLSQTQSARQLSHAQQADPAIKGREVGKKNEMRIEAVRYACRTSEPV
eukprot:scaffold241078_cov14-Tisochrysis_lutea.AAC.1